MAEDKTSFVLYTDKKDLIQKLVEQDRKNGTNNAGELFLHIYSYVCDENPEPLNFTIDIAFEPIKQSLKKDLKKWKQRQSDKSNAGVIGNLKRWHPDLHSEYSNGKISLQKAISIAESRKESQPDKNIAVTVTDTVTVNANVNENVNTDDDVYKSITVLKNAYLKDEKIINSLLAQKRFKDMDHIEKRISSFNDQLTSTGQHSKTWKDYTSHFLNWHKKTKELDKRPTERMNVI